jgi:hypothetical protein
MNPGTNRMSAARGARPDSARRRATVAAVALAAALALAACSSGLPPDNEVRFEDIPLSSQVQPPVEETVIRPEPGQPPLAVAGGFMRAMSTLDPEVASLWVAGDAKDQVARWADAATVEVYSRRSVVEWSEESGGAEVVVGLERQGELVGGSGWRPAAGGRQLTIRLVRDGGEWRVANPPAAPIVASSDFGRLFARAAIYFVARDGKHLTPQPVLLRVPAAGNPTDRGGRQIVGSARALVEQLLLGPRGDAAGALTTAIPEGTRVRQVAVADRVAAVDLTRQFANTSGDLGRLRVGQVVWTVGQLFGVPQVELLIDGEPAGQIGPDHFDASGRWSPSKAPLDGLLPSRRGSDDTVLYTRDGQLTKLSIAGGDPVVVPIAPVGIVRSPTLSPDGQRVAFIVRGGAVDTLWHSSADGREAMPAATLKGRLSDPSWTPDGEQVLILSATPGSGVELWAVRPGSRPAQPRRLQLAPLPGGLAPTTIRVSPDGAFVLAVGAKPGAGFRFNGGGQLFRGRLTAGGVTGWTTTSVSPAFPVVYSPVWAGVDRIAFISRPGLEDDQGSIWVMAQDGWRPERVDLGTDRTINLGDRLAADPRGDRFVFTVHSEAGATELYTTLRVDGTASLRSLTRAPSEDTDPSLASR